MTAKTGSVSTINGLEFLIPIGYSLFLGCVPCSIIPDTVHAYIHNRSSILALPVLEMCGPLDVEGDMAVFSGGVLPVARFAV